MIGQKPSGPREGYHGIRFHPNNPREDGDKHSVAVLEYSLGNERALT